LVFNPKAYASTKAPVYTRTGQKIHNPAKYAAAVKKNAINAAARAAVKSNPTAKAFTYTATLPGKKKYVGMTIYPAKRFADHLSGNGAKCIGKSGVDSVAITPHASVAAANKAEIAMYYQQKKKCGSDKVRGAGHTKKF